MADILFLPEAKLHAWLDAVAKTRRVMVPVKEGNAVMFRDFEPDAPIILGDQTSASPKSVIFPQTEFLLRYRQQRTADEQGTRQIEFEPVYPDEDALLFGANPCGARGLHIMDPVFINDRIVDPYYHGRRSRARIVTIACRVPGAACFCNWTGGAPNSTEGADMLFTPVKDGFLVEIISEGGKELVTDEMTPATEEQIAEAKSAMQKSNESMPPPPADLATLRQQARGAFDDMDLWQEVSDICLNCGACTYHCPTCHCFNITDEPYGLAGDRLRSWDSCMYSHYTREASGHNPRPTKAHKFRNRVLHKFAYYPASHNEQFMCTGCGRCIRHCPVSVDIRRVLTRILQNEPQASSGDKQ